LNVSAILIHDTLQTTFPLSDAVMNEALWQWQLRVTPAQSPASTDQPAVVDLLLLGLQMA